MTFPSFLTTLCAMDVGMYSNISMGDPPLIEVRITLGLASPHLFHHKQFKPLNLGLP